MSPKLADFLADLHRRGLEHDARQSKQDEKVRNLQPETAAVISVLVRSSRRRSVLEIGTSNGYSTIWLAWSVEAIGGRVVSVERNRERQRMAAGNLKLSRLRDLVDLKLGDATEVIPNLPGPFDLVLFDADRVSAPGQLELILPKLSPDALVLADNVRSHPEEISGYLSALEELTDFDRLVLPVGKGLSVAYRQG